jgi:glycosyltransferase involved in cell wall biosynthesis
LIIGIDASNIRAGGGLVHLVNILKFLDVEKFNIEKIVIWSCKNTLNKIEEYAWLKKCSESVMEKNYLHRALWQRKILPLQLNDENCDILFVPGGSFDTKYRPVVTMSQNLIPFELTELCRYGFSLQTIKFILLRFIQSLSFKSANGTIFLTEYAKDAVLKVTQSLKGETLVIPHGIEKGFFLHPRPQLNINEFSSEFPYKLLYVSSIEPYKHHFQVIDAVAKLRADGIPVVLKLIGGAKPNDVNRIKKKIQIIDPLGEFIEYCGSVSHEDLPIEYNSANIFVFASSCETMGITLMEGMASGLPIVCSKKRPMFDILGDAGVYFDPENADSISDAILKLIRSPELRVKNAEMAFEKAQIYSWSLCAESTFSFLSHVLKDYTNNHPGILLHNL